MSWATLINTSLFGRRFGLQQASTNQTGAIAGRVPDLLAGPEDLRIGVTTAETTGTNMAAYGVSGLAGTSAASSAVYVLDPPIPGVRKYISISTTANGPIYVRTANSETFNTTLGTSFTTIKSSAGGAIDLIGFTTAIWLAFNLTSGTSSNGSGFVLTTST